LAGLTNPPLANPAQCKHLGSPLVRAAVNSSRALMNVDPVVARKGVFDYSKSSVARSADRVEVGGRREGAWVDRDRKKYAAAVVSYF
jgi:hypothetical protein